MGRGLTTAPPCCGSRGCLLSTENWIWSAGLWKRSLSGAGPLKGTLLSGGSVLGGASVKGGLLELCRAVRPYVRLPLLLRGACRNRAAPPWRLRESVRQASRIL